MGSKASMVCIDPSECLMVNTYGDGGDRVGASFRPKYSQMVESLAMGTNAKSPQPASGGSSDFPTYTLWR